MSVPSRSRSRRHWTRRVAVAVWLACAPILGCDDQGTGAVALKTGPFRMHDTESPAARQIIATLTSSGNELAALFTDDRSGLTQTYVALSRDAGGSFGPESRLGDAGEPAFAVDLVRAEDGTWVAAYSVETDEAAFVHVMTSIDGVAWSESTVFDPVPEPCGPPQARMRLAPAAGNRVYAARVVTDPRCREHIEVATSRDGGRTFGAFVSAALVLPDSDLIADFALASDGGPGAVLAYIDLQAHALASDEEIARVFVSRSLDGGATFSQPLRVDDRASTPHLRDVVSRLSLTHLGDSGLLACWTDERRNPSENTPDLWCAASYDGGATFSRDARVAVASREPADRFAYGVAVNAHGTALVAWRDGVSAPGGSPVLAALSTDGGNSFRDLGELADPSNMTGGPVVAATASGWALGVHTLATSCARLAEGAAINAEIASAGADLSFGAPVDVAAYQRNEQDLLLHLSTKVNFGADSAPVAFWTVGRAGPLVRSEAKAEMSRWSTRYVRLDDDCARHEEIVHADVTGPGVESLVVQQAGDGWSQPVTAYMTTDAWQSHTVVAIAGDAFSPQAERLKNGDLLTVFAPHGGTGFPDHLDVVSVSATDSVATKLTEISSAAGGIVSVQRLLAFAEEDKEVVLLLYAAYGTALVVRSEDGGATFSAPFALPEAYSGGQLAIAGDMVLAVSVDRDGKLQATASTDGGRTFAALGNVPAIAEPLAPAIALAGNDSGFYMVLSRGRPGWFGSIIPQTLEMWHLDRIGGAWTAMGQFAGTAGSSGADICEGPTVAASTGGEMLVAWGEGRLFSGGGYADRCEAMGAVFE